MYVSLDKDLTCNCSSKIYKKYYKSIIFSLSVNYNFQGCFSWIYRDALQIAFSTALSINVNPIQTVVILGILSGCIVVCVN